ncbi:unnamed protein product [Ilex paraguariensis]|uniref:Uncharacterized protein n=1 Tax=Ilex paraguariensis TaxID=185542 RepID=A0ABC8TBI3_9AQUA
MPDIQEIVNEFVAKLNKRSNTCQTDGSAELAIGNIVRRVLYIIREEELSLLTSDTEELNFPAVSGVDEIIDQDYNSVTSAAAIASRNFLRSPSLRTLLEKMPNSAAACQTSSGGDSGEKCKFDKHARSRNLKHNVIEAVNMPIDDIDTFHE